MRLSKIRIYNYRLLIETELEVHNETTLIVGRNNTAKTSSMDCIRTVLNGKEFSYNDFPIDKRGELHSLIAQFMSKDIKFDELCEKMPVTSIEFVVDYSSENLEEQLGALSPFIIDIDLDINDVLIRIDNRVKIEEKTLWNLLEHSCYKNGRYDPDIDQMRSIVINNFNKIFGQTIYAINPKNKNDKQIR